MSNVKKSKGKRSPSTARLLILVFSVPAVYLIVLLSVETSGFLKSMKKGTDQHGRSKRISYGPAGIADIRKPAPPAPSETDLSDLSDKVRLSRTKSKEPETGTRQEQTAAPRRESRNIDPAPLSENNVQVDMVSSTSREWEDEGPPEALLDGDPKTRWSSEYKDGQEVVIDLGRETPVAGLRLLWEKAAAKTYAVSLSSDGMIWQTAWEKTGGKAGPRTDEIDLGGARTRFIRLDLFERATKWGFSLYEIEIIGQQEA